MATLPTLEEAESFILEKFHKRNSRPGESFRTLSLMTDIMGTHFRSDDINQALNSMIEKGWVELRQGGLFLALTEKGFNENSMPALPTLEEAERFILGMFNKRSSRPGESIRTLNLMTGIEGTHFRGDDINQALDSMIEKGWIELRQGGHFLALTEEGFAQV